MAMITIPSELQEWLSGISIMSGGTMEKGTVRVFRDANMLVILVVLLGERKRSPELSLCLANFSETFALHYNIY